MTSRKVGIIGNGAYGKFFRDFFEKRGCEVRVADDGTNTKNKTALPNSAVATWADIVLVATTLLGAVRAIKKLAPSLRRNQLIMDITSVKSSPVDAMLRSHASVLGMHPFTAPPKSGSFKGQTIFVCSVRMRKEWRKSFRHARKY